MEVIFSVIKKATFKTWVNEMSPQTTRADGIDVVWLVVSKFTAILYQKFLTLQK